MLHISFWHEGSKGALSLYNLSRTDFDRLTCDASSPERYIEYDDGSLPTWTKTIALDNGDGRSFFVTLWTHEPPA